MDLLSNANPHERDEHIEFDEGPHIYTIDGDSDFMSVTTWNHSHFEHFDADAIIARMMRSKKWGQNKYFGKSRPPSLVLCVRPARVRICRHLSD